MRIVDNNVINGKPSSPHDDGHEEDKYLPGILQQYYATFTVCVAAFALGASGGWISPVLLTLESEESPVGRMTTLEISPLETLPSIAAAIGTVIYAGILTKYGRKPCGYLASCFSILGWSSLLTANYPWQLYVGRFLLGLSTVGLAMIGPIYLSEIAYVSVRGTLMTYTQFAAQCGSLTSFLLGSVCGYRTFTAICMISPVLFPLVFYRIPESPQFLLLQSKNMEARQALLWYRGGKADLVDREMEELMKIQKRDLRWRAVLQNRGNRKAIMIFVFMFCFSALAGTAVISGYASKIFQNADSAIDPNSSAAILASIKFIAALAAIQLIDRFGRKVLVLFSFISMSACLIVLTIYSFVQENDVDVTRMSYVPIASLSTYVATHTLGVGTVSEVIASEMLTPDIKGVAIGFVGIIGTGVTLLTLQLYALFITYGGSSLNFLFESVFAVSAIFISWWIVPETKGKTLAEISDMLNGNTIHVSKKNHNTRL